MDIRPYLDSDRDACLAVFDSNTPDLLPSEARPALAAFLEAPGHPFFVAEHDGAVIGCGGYVVIENAARLQWGMVARRSQRQGLGRFLLFYRMREITRSGAVEMVSLQTPRAAAGFFTGQGFREVSGDANAAEMTKRLSVCA